MTTHILTAVLAAAAGWTWGHRTARVRHVPISAVKAQGQTVDCPRCVCGDPIEWMDHPDDPGWIHSPGSDTPCLDARLAPADDLRSSL